MKYLAKKGLYLVLAAALCTLPGCQPEEYKSGNELTNSDIDAGFTITPIDNSPNRFLLESTSGEMISNFWNIGTGLYQGGASTEIFLPDAGTYTIEHTVYGSGGATNVSSQTIVVDTSDPVSGNLIVGGTFTTPDDIAAWSILQIAASNAAWSFNNGEASLNTTAAWAQQGLYQAIQVQGGHTYKFDMKVSGPALSNAFFELYADYAVPVAGQEYSAGGKVLQINTWDGCGNTPFSGQLLQLSCGNTAEGLKYFDTDGTVYVFLRGGNEFGSFNITIDNVEVRRID